jgi:hypothetical protein
MITKAQMIAIIKQENPTLQTGSDETGYIQLSSQQYEAQIAEWADGRLAKLVKAAEAEAKAQAKAELLERLGITADEAKLLLA